MKRKKFFMLLCILTTLLITVLVLSNGCSSASSTTAGAAAAITIKSVGSITGVGAPNYLGGANNVSVSGKYAYVQVQLIMPLQYLI